MVDVRTLHAEEVFTLTTDAGDLDLIATPPGSTGFDAVERGAAILELDDALREGAGEGRE